MNTNYKSNIAAGWHRQILTAVCLSAFLFVTAAFAQTPTLRANGKIAFASNRDGNLEIYVMNSDGSGQVRLTNNPGVDDYPAWSPDGRRLAFLSQNASSNYVIKLMNADGTGQTELTAAAPNTGNPSWNWVPRWRMDWSPDGSKIAFTNSGEIFSINIDGSNRVNLTNQASFDSHPSWSPDGSQIIFSSDRATNEYSFRWFTMNADGSNQTQLAGGLGQNYVSDVDPAWSPDGSKLAGVWVWVLDVGVFLIRDVSGNVLFWDFTIDRDSSTPAWSPDGTKVVYSAIVSPTVQYSNSKIFVINADGTGLTQLTNTSNFNAHPTWQPLVSTPAFADFDGDGRSDISVFRPSDGIWYLNQSTNGFSASQFGLSIDKIIPADYDGDGKTDVAVFRDGFWYWLNSSNGSFQAAHFGQTGDVPVPADYTGDGRAEIAVFRGGFWYSLDLSNNQFTGLQFGFGSDKPVAADYDGDGKADVAVVRQENGVSSWYILGSTNGFYGFQFGADTDKLVPADYDGDGKTDIAVFRPDNGVWYLMRSNLGFTGVQFGFGTDTPVPADYDGDGKADVAVFRDGTWYLQQSTNGFSGVQFGLATDTPVPASYVP